jgi:hypothetical protein
MIRRHGETGSGVAAKKVTHDVDDPVTIGFGHRGVQRQADGRLKIVAGLR